MKKESYMFLLWLLALLLLLTFMLGGCRSKIVYVPVDSVRVEHKDRIWRDSIYLYDSVFVRLAKDTVKIEKFKYIYRDRFVHDSIFRTDSISVPYPVIETREVNRLRTWQIVFMCLGGAFIGGMGVKMVRYIRFV